MGRKTILLGFWLLGYALGFLAWLIRKPVSEFILGLGVNQDIAGALLAGLAGSFLMLVAVLVWSALE